MSEELLQTEARPIGRYSYYKLGASTLQQLRDARIIKTSVPKELRTKKPDGLITLHGGATKAVIEYKPPAKLRTKVQIRDAVDQELAVAKALCKVLIVTSGSQTIWVNALNGERIRTSTKDELRFTVNVKAIGSPRFDAQEFERLLDAAEASLTATTNVIAQPSVVDPSSLANAIWQKIWVHTGKTPEKCLYNVVELFVFKFLTDLGVLKPHVGFWSVASLAETGSPDDALTHYAQIGRKAVQKLFPPGKDGTTIINGTIFVNEAGAPNIAQARLFAEIVRDLISYDADSGSFRYIKREFKTRLYESFLRQSAGVRALGQYFTPRNVVQAMVRMTRKVNRGARICDPFCGVGGFLLELLVENDDLLKEFTPKAQGAGPQITLIGYDKGTDEQEDERTIILAKANMLIYFSDLLADRHSPSDLKAFCDHGLNSVFRLLRSNLGTFDQTEDEPYDLILTNPPYVTKGSKSLQDTLAKCVRTAQFYDFGLKGTEGLALNWIIKKLRPSGEAFVIVPDTVLRRVTVLRKLQEHCRVMGIVALPNRTFYATPRQTYILALEKKSEGQTQDHPVFAYIVREMGETQGLETHSDRRQRPRRDGNAVPAVPGRTGRLHVPVGAMQGGAVQDRRQTEGLAGRPPLVDIRRTGRTRDRDSPESRRLRHVHHRNRRAGRGTPGPGRTVPGRKSGDSNPDQNRETGRPEPLRVHHDGDSLGRGTSPETRGGRRRCRRRARVPSRRQRGRARLGRPRQTDPGVQGRATDIVRSER